MSAPTDQQRIDELEIKLAFQERTIAQLNDVLTDYSQRLSAMERALQRLREQANASPADADTDATPEPPPPHY